MQLCIWEADYKKRGWPHIFSMPQHCFVAKQSNMTLFCRETLKYFLSQNVEIRAMSRKNAINCVPSRLRILISPALHGSLEEYYQAHQPHQESVTGDSQLPPFMQHTRLLPYHIFISKVQNTYFTFVNILMCNCETFLWQHIRDRHPYIHRESRKHFCQHLPILGCNGATFLWLQKCIKMV